MRKNHFLINFVLFLRFFLRFRIIIPIYVPVNEKPFDLFVGAVMPAPTVPIETCLCVYLSFLFPQATTNLSSSFRSNRSMIRSALRFAQPSPATVCASEPK